MPNKNGNTYKEHRRFYEIKKLSNPNIDTDMQKIQKALFDNLWKDNLVIEEINLGKHDDVFDEEEKKELKQMIEQDNFDMREQRILSGIRKDKKKNYEVLKEIFGIEEKKVA
mgnify:CR=1 FL=1